MKKTFRFYIALWVAKITARILKIMRRNASSTPGAIALKICPDFMGIIEKPQTIIGVTGSEGKTTTTSLINSILIEGGYNTYLGGNIGLEQYGYPTLNNKLGSNINSGIASSLLNGANMLGRTKKQVAVLEIDERSSIKIYPYVKPTYIVCTNIFRDSIKRNAHTDFIVDIINSSIPKESTLILNADDLICCSIGPENKKKIYYGIDKLDTDLEKTNNILIQN